MSIPSIASIPSTSSTPRLVSPAEFLAIDACPRLVLTDNLWSLIGWKIKAHTHGHYNHAMWLHAPGRVASQGWRFRSEPLADYLRGRHRVKLWWSPQWPPHARRAMLDAIERDLRRRGRYDWLGIVGQWLRIAGIEFPWRDYCSEQAARVLRIVAPRTPAHPAPADLDRLCRSLPEMEAVVYDPSL